MPKLIKLKIEETFEVPDSWEIVTNKDGMKKIKISDDEFLDFGISFFTSDTLDSHIDYMLSNEEQDSLENNYIVSQSYDSDIVEV